MDDLISRAATIEQIKENYCYWCDHIDLCQSCETQDCIATIEQQVPAVDAAPVAHARWIDENLDDFLDPRMRCSICAGVESPLIKWRYCPNCGAKMDGDT